MYYVQGVKPHPTLPSGEPEYLYWHGGKKFLKQIDGAKKYGTFGHANNAAGRLFESRQFPEFCAILPVSDAPVPIASNAEVYKDDDYDLGY